jgi:hypothetical protein
VPEVTKLVEEARSLVRDALAAIDELAIEPELKEIERCLYGVDERLTAIGRVNGNESG